MSWQTVLGFEIHIELATQSKMFCGCPADHFGKVPNTQTCPVCLGMPGGLPVPNAKAVEWCVKLGLALGCQINLFSKFDRKNYFYPDLAKGYQISQYDLPFCYEGSFQGHAITRVHLEEDTGKLIHRGTDTLVDFNRSGVPLVEIVTAPDFSSVEEAIEFLKDIQSVARSLKISSADMEKGSMRIEPNVSVRPTAQKELPDYKIELKNINSFRFVKKAVLFEVDRQTKILESGKTPIQETRGFVESTGQTASQRTKENAHDYRYFPDPDIPPIRLSESQVAVWKSELPKAPSAIRAELVETYGLSSHYATVLSEDKILLDKFFQNPSKDTANQLVNKRTQTVVTQISQDKVRESALAVVSANPRAVSDFKSGKIQALFFMLGQLKKVLPEVDPAVAKQVLEDIINE
jgi:aspartyl-tRNA(Asn)/glutamyl-tRNA(Gln) amidotransferase subunit B